MARYVVRYEIRAADPADPSRSIFKSMGERDVEVGLEPTTVSYHGPRGPFEDVRDEVGTINDPIIWQELNKLIVIPSGCHAVITDIRPVITYLKEGP